MSVLHSLLFDDLRYLDVTPVAACRKQLMIILETGDPGWIQESSWGLISRTHVVIRSKNKNYIQASMFGQKY